MALSQMPSHALSSDVAQLAPHAPGQRSAARSKKLLRASKIRSGRLSSSGKQSAYQSEGIRTIAEELLAKAGGIIIVGCSLPCTHLFVKALHELCVCKRERERECVCKRERERECVCVCVCVCVRERERERE
jgi:hypothetical protein